MSENKKIKLLKNLQNTPKGEVMKLDINGLVVEFVKMGDRTLPVYYLPDWLIAYGVAEWVKDEPEEGEEIYYISNMTGSFEVVVANYNSNVPCHNAFIKGGNWTRDKATAERAKQAALKIMEKKG